MDHVEAWGGPEESGGPRPCQEGSGQRGDVQRVAQVGQGVGPAPSAGEPAGCQLEPREGGSGSLRAATRLRRQGLQALEQTTDVGPDPS